MNTIKNRKKKGFTLIELIAVVAILAVLAAVAVPKVIEYVNKSKKVAVQTTASTVYNAAEAAYNDGTLESAKGETKGINGLTVSTVIADLEKNNLISNVDTTKLGTLNQGSMGELYGVIESKPENIDVTSEGVYTKDKDGSATK